MKINDIRNRINYLLRAIEALKCEKTLLYDNAYQCTLNKGANINIVVVGGIHGDEPAGICSAIELATKAYPKSQMLTIIPCANPTGYNADTRENSKNQDINREFDDGKLQDEEIILRDIASQADILITMHEDDVHDGCYVYAPKLHSDVGRKALSAMSKFVPIHESDTVFKEPCNNGLVTELDMQNPKHGNSLEGFGKKMGVPSFCLEVPKNHSFDNRVKALVQGALAIIYTFQ